MQKDLYTKTLDLLRSDQRTLREIADGADLNYHWLTKFKQGVFKNPGVRTIESLYLFLAKTSKRGKAA